MPRVGGGEGCTTVKEMIRRRPSTDGDKKRKNTEREAGDLKNANDGRTKALWWKERTKKLRSLQAYVAHPSGLVGTSEKRGGKAWWDNGNELGERRRGTR